MYGVRTVLLFLNIRCTMWALDSLDVDITLAERTFLCKWSCLFFLLLTKCHKLVHSLDHKEKNQRNYKEINY